jgi:hypothetical protein
VPPNSGKAAKSNFNYALFGGHRQENYAFFVFFGLFVAIRSLSANKMRKEGFLFRKILFFSELFLIIYHKIRIFPETLYHLENLSTYTAYAQVSKSGSSRGVPNIWPGPTLALTFVVPPYIYAVSARGNVDYKFLFFCKFSNSTGKEEPVLQGGWRGFELIIDSFDCAQDKFLGGGRGQFVISDCRFQDLLPG